ncbi:uncharacterized protein B0I36DRAFT_312180 [Microdochium trichocladiopsis]|uniref:Uncharacterized protein n=1 Tax=Microdochium trichocladiopsis TaxID=1682393 RepID=A0A9P8YLE2_9PEZI|nr:uncharacterized protein B0I36DRAFT_312180 [Microdochium trichocladiopsis]KAH7041125.1 hypothetical protein B0I36DRAFT_312180 [Microdochium trichocladiopsis]
MYYMVLYFAVVLSDVKKHHFGDSSGVLCFWLLLLSRAGSLSTWPGRSICPPSRRRNVPKQSPPPLILESLYEDERLAGWNQG